MKIKHPDGLQVLIAIDQLLNTLLCGYADESMSSRAHRLAIERGRKWPEKIIDALFFWQEDHCLKSYESELERSQLPPALREKDATDSAT